MAVAPSSGGLGAEEFQSATPSPGTYSGATFGPAAPKSYYEREPLTQVTQQIATSVFSPTRTTRESNFAEHPAAVQTTQGTNVGAPDVPSSPLDPELGGGVSGEEIQGGPIFRGALGSTIQAARSTSPFAILLIVGGLALLGYWAYSKYGGRLGL